MSSTSNTNGPNDTSNANDASNAIVTSSSSATGTHGVNMNELDWYKRELENSLQSEALGGNAVVQREWRAVASGIGGRSGVGAVVIRSGSGSASGGANGSGSGGGANASGSASGAAANEVDGQNAGVGANESSNR
jgi:hypothetical protein